MSSESRQPSGAATPVGVPYRKRRGKGRDNHDLGELRWIAVRMSGSSLTRIAFIEDGKPILTLEEAKRNMEASLSVGQSRPLFSGTAVCL